MKRKKWFIMAALIGLALSVGFLVVSCSIEDIIKSGCKGMSCSPGSINCSSLNCR